MKKWKAYIAGLATIASLSGSLWAQAPAIPGVPAAPGVPGAAAATPVGGLHQFLGLTPEIKEAKKRYICSKPIGMMMSQMLAPMRAFTGGLFGNCCPGPSLLDTLKPGAEGAANKIKKDEAEAKARRAAMRYLGTVDCHFWPEAEKELIGGLRADRNECVRWEAAMALGGGCCCTKRTIEALLISATGSDKDGNPSETCDRVRAAAFASLQHCLSCFSEEVAADKKLDKPPEAPKPEAPKDKPEKLSGLDSSLQLTGYYDKLDAKPMSQTVSEARKAVSAGSGLSFKEHRKLPSGERGMYNILAHSLDLLPMESKAVNLTQAPVASDAVVTSEQMPVGAEMKAVHTESVPVKTVPMPVKMDKAPLFGPTTPLAKPAVDVKPVDVKPMLPATTKPVSAKPMDMKPMAAAPVKPVDVKPTTVVKAPESKPMTFTPVESRPMVATPVAAKPMDVKPMVMTPVTTTASQLPATMTTAAPVASTNGPNPQQLLVVLRNSIYPFQREWAVDNLSNVDWRSNPEVVQALMSAARKDAAPTVRVMCIRALVKMKVDTVPVVTAIQALRSDPDPRVEHEAQAALTALGHAQQASASTGSIQPASMTTTGGAVVPAGWNTPAKTAPASYGVGYPR